MDKTRYLPPTNGGRWTVSREVEGQWIALIENAPPFHQNDLLTVLVALAIPPTPENLDRYFPIRGEKGRCPTLELLELFSELGAKAKSDGRSNI